MQAAPSPVRKIFDQAFNQGNLTILDGLVSSDLLLLPPGCISIGCAIQRYDEQAIAVSHRNVKYVIAINTGWDDPKATEKQIQWTRDLWTAVRPSLQAESM